MGHDVGFLTLGPKLDPPFFACRPKMDPSGGSRVCVCDRGDHPPPLGMWMTSRGQCPRGGGCLSAPGYQTRRQARRFTSARALVLIFTRVETARVKYILAFLLRNACFRWRIPAPQLTARWTSRKLLRFRDSPLYRG